MDFPVRSAIAETGLKTGEDDTNKTKDC